MYRHFLTRLAAAFFALSMVIVALAQPAASHAQSSAKRFSIAVIPDTQYLFDQDRGNADVLKATVQWIIDNTEKYNIVFTAHLGDLVENADASEFEAASAVFRMFDEKGIQYSVPAGNHDLKDSGTFSNARDKDESFLNYFGAAKRLGDQKTFGGVSPDGYSSFFRFSGAGQDWLLFALDWQASEATLAWAQGVIDTNPKLPAILTTHQLVEDDGSGQGKATITEYGNYLWENLIRKNDQVFLTLNGHYWPPARTVVQNAAGHDVHMHITNYQDRYYGGAGTMRLYQFDLDQNTVDVSTFAPWVMAKPAAQRNALDVAEYLDPVNHFTLPLGFAERFSGFSGINKPAAQVRDVKTMVVANTVAYWRFEGEAGKPLGTQGVVVRDLSGNGNDLMRVDLANSKPADLIWTSDRAEGQPGAGSIFVNGSKRNPKFGGSYLRTADDAMLNKQTFEKGYTIEAFVKLPADCCDDKHAWMGVLARMGTGKDIGQKEDDPDEPVTQFAISPGRQLQWAIRTTNLQTMLTNWSHEVDANHWYHVAIVNDGRQTVMFVDGAPILRNPKRESIGLATTNEYWLIGAGHYAREVEQAFYGNLGDIRIVARPLTPAEFMNAR